MVDMVELVNLALVLMWILGAAKAIVEVGMVVL